MLALVFAAALQTAPVTAVLELRNKLDGADRNLIDAAFLTDVVRQQALEEVPSLKLMTRENVLLLLEASGKKLEECEGECEVETGRRLGADLIVTGELLRFGKGLRANLRLYDTHSTQLLSAAVASGETPEALEKDLVRAVAKLMVPLRGAKPVEPRSAEWVDTFGLFIAIGLGAIQAENDTPRALASGTFTMSNLQQTATELGLGARYLPLPWLMLDAAFVPASQNAQADTSAPDGTKNAGAKMFNATAIVGSVNGVLRPISRLHVFGGLGAEFLNGRVDPDSTRLDSQSQLHLHKTSGTGNFDDSEGFVRPFARLGVEWRPQERVGLSVFGVLYPISQEVDVYVHDTSSSVGTTTPVLKYTLPTVKADASLAFYF